MDFSVVAFDIDGTLLTSDQQILPSTLAAIDALKASDVQVVLASGRTPASLIQVARDGGLDLDGVRLLGCNGAQLADAEGRELLRRPLDLALAREMIVAGRNLGATMMVLEANTVMADDRQSPWPEPETFASKMVLEWWDDLTEITTAPPKLLFFEDPEPLGEIERRIVAKFGQRAIFAYSAPFCLEATAVGVTKASGLRLLCEQLGVSMGQVIAFGDQGNDREMIEAAGLGVAMGNAIDELKAVADVVTGTNDEGGIAQLLAQHFDGVRWP